MGIVVCRRLNDILKGFLILNYAEKNVKYLRLSVSRHFTNDANDHGQLTVIKCLISDYYIYVFTKLTHFWCKVKIPA